MIYMHVHCMYTCAHLWDEFRNDVDVAFEMAAEWNGKKVYGM